MEYTPEVRVIDNQTFLIGFDQLFRGYQKKYESTVLLPITDGIIEQLHLKVIQSPVEGYYSETPELTRYFLQTKLLQGQSSSLESSITDIEGFHKLKTYATSSIFGTSLSSLLLPQCRDVLAQALSETYPDWTVVNIVNKAFQLAKEEIDPSLVGLACLSRDEIVITAMRETVALYSAVEIATSLKKEITYDWQVDDKIADAANVLVSKFNKLTGYDMPEVSEENAGLFYSSNAKNSILGRCINIGLNENGTKYYHWAITKDATTKELVVEDFWDTRLWTTKEYKEKISKE